MAAVIRVTRLNTLGLPGEPITQDELLVPVARIDTASRDVIAEYEDNSYIPIARAVTKITKVNGDFIYVAETLDAVESLIAHAGRN